MGDPPSGLYMWRLSQRCLVIMRQSLVRKRQSRLELGPKTEICPGLVHNTDGIEGTMTRLRTARKHTESFAIAMECGFARRDPVTIPSCCAFIERSLRKLTSSVSEMMQSL